MGEVYFIEAPGESLVKIGYSGNTQQRLLILKGSSPVELRLVGIIENVDKGLEAKIHKIFEDDRRHGEWFELTDDLKTLIADPEKFDLDEYAEALDAAMLPRYLELDNKGRWLMVFGKHFGELLEDVILCDYDYIDWMLWKGDFPSSVQEVIAAQLRLAKKGGKNEQRNS